MTAYFEGAKSTKTHYFIKCAADVSHERTDKYEAAWLPLASMLTKYGKAELIDHVKEGSISCRPHPKNKKFWQFQDEVESTGTEVKNKRSFGTVSDADTNKDAFLKFAKGDTKCLGSDLEGWSLEDLNDAKDGSDATGSVFAALGIANRGSKNNPQVLETDAQKMLKDIDSKSIILKDDNEEKVLKKAKFLSGLLCELKDKALSKCLAETDKKKKSCLKHSTEKLTMAAASLDQALMGTSVPKVKAALLSAATAMKEAVKDGI